MPLDSFGNLVAPLQFQPGPVMAAAATGSAPQPTAPSFGYTPGSLSLPTPSPMPSAASPAAGGSPNTLTLDYGTKYFVSKGYTPAQAQGMTQALLGESGGDPAAYNAGGGGLGAYGIAQDRASRQSKMVQFYGPTPTVQQQLDYALYELNTSEKGANAAIRQAQTSQQARAAMSGRFERPGGSSAADSVVSDIQQRDQATQRDLKRIEGETSSLGKEIASLNVRDPDSVKQLAHYREKMEEYEQRALDAALHPPTENMRDGIQRAGSIATIVGMLGGLMTKTPMIASLNAGAAAMQAMKQDDMDAYKMAMDRWKIGTEALMNMAKFENDMYRDVLDDEKTTWSHKLDLMNARGNMLGNERIAAMAQSGDMFKLTTAVENMYKVRETANISLARLQIAQENLDLRQKMAPAAQQALAAAKAASEQKLGRPLTDEEYHDLILEESGKFKIASSGMPEPLKYPDKWEGMPDKPPPGVREDVWDATLFFARTHQMPALGFQPGMRQFMIQAYPAALHALGIPPAQAADIAAEYAGERHGNVVLGGRAATLGMAVNEAEAIMPLALAASEQVSRTEYPTLNGIIEAYLRGTGDPQIVRLATLTYALQNVMAQVAARQGASTDLAKKRASDTLTEAYAKGQYRAAAKAMMDEANAALTAPGKTQSTLRQTFAPPGVAGAAGGAAPPPQIGSKEEYDKLPSGAAYVWGPTGQQGIKP
jgi:Phage tail lysozyme